MKRYVANCNKIVSCIYGMRQFVEGLEVPEIFARRFPQYVTCEDIPEVIIEDVNEEIIEEKSQTKKGK